MKNAYLNNVFISRLYLRTIKKKPKQKYIVNKTNKDEKKIIKYIESQCIPFNLLNMKIEQDYKKKKKEFEMDEKKKRMR